MLKKNFIIILGCLPAVIAGGAYAADTDSAPKVPYESVKDRASKSMTEMLYGTTEVKNADGPMKAAENTQDEGSLNAHPVSAKGITRMIDGIWELATFWTQQSSSESQKEKTKE